ncbi:MAG: 2-isopropylmalate synthase [Chloroflexi bacterium]|jgi:2-isopropylmalate synthase|nr:MAG: 2-isopropylmalate synthase [Chloroflexota bacterium]
MDEDRVIFLDTTLRDGEQAAGAGMSGEEKLEIARQLERLGIDIIEAGFPASSQGDFEAVQTIAREIRKPTICALAHANPNAIDRAWEAIKDARQPRIHVFLSTSDIHIMHQLRRGKEEVMDQAVENVRRAKGYTDDVEFSPMDATRTEPGFLYAMLAAVIEAGATTINIPDTVGYAIPEEFGKLIAGIRENVKGADKVRISVHCHDDLGMAVANSLAAVKNGARQVEGCINGIGERAGNAALEEVIMGLETRRDFMGVSTNIDTKQIYRSSRMVSDITGFPVQPNKAVVGANAFRHASGIHQDGVIKERSTYEIMDPQEIGLPSNMLVLGKLSGRAGLRSRLEELGYQLSTEQLAQVFERFKGLADKKREVTDRDLDLLMREEYRAIKEAEPYKLEHIQFISSSTDIPTATIRIIDPSGRTISEAATGNGPVDAVYNVINRVVGVPNQLLDYQVQAVSGGMDAVAEVTVRIESNGVVSVGRGSDTDTLSASAKAYMNALNRLIAMGGGQPATTVATP